MRDIEKWKFSNCLIFAFIKWYRHGGYVVIRRAHHGWWPHFIWCRDLKDAEIEHLQPDLNYYPETTGKLLFRGRINRTDTLNSDPQTNLTVRK